MNSFPRLFVRQFVGVVAAALIPVVLVTFCSIPFNLGGHPGEARVATASTSTHMT